MRAGRERGYRDRRSAGPGGGGYSTETGLGSTRPSRRIEHPSSNHSYHMHQIGNMGPPIIAGSMGSNMPGGSNTSTSIAYLSPPLDSSWRRTHSDSALHQAAMAMNETIFLGSTSPTLPKKGIDSQTLEIR